MNKSIAAIVSSFSLVLFALAPVCAEEPGGAAKSDKSTDKAEKTEAGGVKGFIASFPKRFVASIPGTIVGTPIAIVRMSKREIGIAAKDLVGETSNPIFLAPAYGLAITPGIMSGTIYGVFAGAADAWKNSEDAPFSKEAFSLGDMK